MPDLAKVIKGLECSIGTRGVKDCMDCPYDAEEQCIGCDALLLRDAIELLKSQAPHVMTIEEVRESTNMKWHAANGAMWLETRFGAIAPCLADLEYQGEFRVYSLYLHPQNGSNTTWWAESYYNKAWRCWTRMPTQEQRREAEWDVW